MKKLLVSERREAAAAKVMGNNADEYGEGKAHTTAIQCHLFDSLLKKSTRLAGGTLCTKTPSENFTRMTPEKLDHMIDSISPKVQTSVRQAQNNN